MELGLNALPLPADEWYWRDLGVTWCKWAADIDQPEEHLDDRRQFELAARWGLRTCVDLRTSSQWMTEQGTTAWAQLHAADKLLSLPEGRTFEEQDHVVKANQRAVHEIVLERITEQARAYVSRYRDCCCDWEWWGESDCPATSAGIFHILTYPETLKVVYQAIKDVQPEARVWTGGNGMDINDGWVKGLQRDGALKSFDILNWHPFALTLRDRPAIEERLHEAYGEWRKTLAAEGLNQPYAATEWGYPSLRAATHGQREWLESHVVKGRISQLYPEEALEFYGRDLCIMEQYGFQVVMVHTLRDTKSRHWGSKCGLLTLPIKGLWGRAIRALWRTAEAKPVYGLVREWAQRGAAGRPAFAT